MLNIVIPMAGTGKKFKEAGYTFPKPLIDVKGKTMIEIVVENLRPETEHRFIFICQKEHYEKYDLYNILKKATNNRFEVIQINGATEGAACTALLAKRMIDNDEELLIANADQFIEVSLDHYLEKAREGSWDGYIMTFSASHPRWSYVGTDEYGRVIEVAEKRVISSHATVGIYYYKHGRDFVIGAQNMIRKNIRYNNEFYISPVYNELMLAGKNIGIYEIAPAHMHGLGTPEELVLFLNELDRGTVNLGV